MTAQELEALLITKVSTWGGKTDRKEHTSSCLIKTPIYATFISKREKYSNLLCSIKLEPLPFEFIPHYPAVAAEEAEQNALPVVSVTKEHVEEMSEQLVEFPLMLSNTQDPSPMLHELWVGVSQAYGCALRYTRAKINQKLAAPCLFWDIQNDPPKLPDFRGSENLSPRIVECFGNPQDQEPRK